MTTKSLEFPYEQVSSMKKLQHRIHDCIEGISLGFDNYDDDRIKGPGLYITIVSTRSVAAFAEPMGANTWPTEMCSNVSDDLDQFYNAAQTVAQSRDGGVCIGVDGTILEQMVRFKNVSGDELTEGMSTSGLTYADWMGARHMSAYETSLRPEVVTTITLSEESGRVTTFHGDGYRTRTRDTLGEPWRDQDTL